MIKRAGPLFVVGAAAVGLVAAAAADIAQPVVVVALLLAGGVCGFRSRRSIAVAAAAVALIAGVTASLIDPGVDVADAVQSIVVLAAAPLLGHLIARSMRRRVEVAALRADAVVAASRREVARDVHDITSHALMAVITQLRVADRGLDRADPASARTAVGAAHDAAAGALRELRGLTAMIADGAPVGARCESVATLFAELDRTCRGYDGATFEVIGEAADDPVEPQIGVALVRVVEQCLANAAAHAPGSPPRLTAAVRERRLIVNSTNREGTGGSGSTGSGMGLGIMRRRASDVGGTLTVEQVDGEFRVTCEMPLVRPA